MGKESRQLDKEALNQPADSVLFAAGTSKHSRPSSSSEGRTPEETCHGKASGMGPISKTLIIQDSCCSQLNKSTAKLVSLSPF